MNNQQIAKVVDSQRFESRKNVGPALFENLSGSFGVIGTPVAYLSDIMIALNDYITETVPATTRQPSLHVIGGDSLSRGFVVNQLARMGFAAQESATPAALLVHESDQELQRRRTFWAAVEQRMSKLTIKDREVLDLLMECLPNKVLAARLGITERAVEMRRASLMKKLEVRSLTELVRLVTKFAVVQQYGLLLAIY